jgi:probable HAF family extracellular repeat protein
MSKHTRTPTRIPAAAACLLAALALASAASARPDTSGDTSVGFLLDRGRYEVIDLPGSEVTGAFGISTINGINNRGRIVGKAVDADAEGFYGLVGDRRGRFRRFDFPGALATYANKIDDRGRIVGVANRTAPEVGVPGTFGYLLARGGFTRIAYPGAVSTEAIGINNRGRVVGGYLDQNGVGRGFRWQNGRFTTFDGPPGPNAGLTALTDINDRGDMVGAYVAGTGTVRGFLLRKGKYRTFQALGLAGTLPFDINNRGQIAGFALNADATEAHGFLLAKGVDGPVTQIDVPGAPRTAVTGLDDRGRIVGFVDFRLSTAPGPQRSRAAAMPLLDALHLGLTDGKETR